MSDPTDIKGLDEYLKGGSDVSQRYRELGRDEVPPELDSRVLASARAAVANQSTKRSRSWLRWSTPIALAASVVLVVTVVLERGGQNRLVAIPPYAVETPQPSSEMTPKVESAANAIEERKQTEDFAPQPASVTRAVPPPPQQPAKEKSEARRDEADEADEAQLFGFAPPSEVPAQAPEVRDEAQPQLRAAPSAVAPPPEPVTVTANNSLERNKSAADSSAEIQEVVITGMRRSAGRGAGPRGTVTRAVSSTQATPAAESEQSDPQTWLEDIRDLRRAGKTDEADREWERFRKAFPDFEVADDDIARKKP